MNPTPADPSQTHAEAIAWARKGCSVKISSDWPLLESQIFGLCVREKGYGSVQFAPQQGQEPLGTFNLTVSPHDYRWGSGLHSSKSASNNRADRA